MILNDDYHERVYAGVLGKLIGVYLGRPFEGWEHERIIEKLGFVDYYVHEKLGMPLVVTDDDIAGTFTFLRALPDHGFNSDLGSREIGDTWLNYLIEGRTILWWGGLGNSTEHTAYLRLKNGIPAPRSGSALINSAILAEQIGAQIFIDGWAMATPGDPEKAADFARRAASVSHDGEAIYAAQVIAAMESQAFIENDLNKLLDTAQNLIPKTSVIYSLISDLRDWREKEPDWLSTFQKIRENYGVERYGGNCHVVPNHALIHLGLLYGDDDFQKTLMIVNTCGWDTDCNSGNAGCLMGIKNGLPTIDRGPDWRGPIADRLYLSTADGGRAITDAVTETYHITNTGYGMAGKQQVNPKRGARFHFELPGSVQGFEVSNDPVSSGALSIQNTSGHSVWGKRSLALTFREPAQGRTVGIATPTFIPPEAVQMPGYALLASPTLYAGQKIRAGLRSDEQNLAPFQANLLVRCYGPGDEVCTLRAARVQLTPGGIKQMDWVIPSTQGCPIFEAGLEISAESPMDGKAYLDYMTWEGEPETTFPPVGEGAELWRRSWVQGVDEFFTRPGDPYRLVQNRGRGLLMQGTRQWKDYCIQVDLTPHFAASCGIAVRVQGMRRYMAVLFDQVSKIRLVKVMDQESTILEREYPFDFEKKYHLTFQVKGNRYRFWIDEKLVLDADENAPGLDGGGIGLVVEEGCASYDNIRVSSNPEPAVEDI